MANVRNNSMEKRVLEVTEITNRSILDILSNTRANLENEFGSNHHSPEEINAAFELLDRQISAFIHVNFLVQSKISIQDMPSEKVESFLQYYKELIDDDKANDSKFNHSFIDEVLLERINQFIGRLSVEIEQRNKTKEWIATAKNILLQFVNAPFNNDTDLLSLDLKVTPALSAFEKLLYTNDESREFFELLKKRLENAKKIVSDKNHIKAWVASANKILKSIKVTNIEMLIEMLEHHISISPEDLTLLRTPSQQLVAPLNSTLKVVLAFWQFYAKHQDKAMLLLPSINKDIEKSFSTDRKKDILCAYLTTTTSEDPRELLTVLQSNVVAKIFSNKQHLTLHANSNSLMNIIADRISTIQAEMRLTT